MRRGITFQIKLSPVIPVSAGMLDAPALDAELEKGHADMKNDRVRAKKEVFADMKRDYDL